jgi:hypothetical protein
MVGSPQPSKLAAGRVSLTLVSWEGSVVGLPSAPQNLARSRRRLSCSTESQHREKRGALKGPIRIPLRSLLFLFNALEFPSISSKSLKFRPVLFSIYTALGPDGCDLE